MQRRIGWRIDGGRGTKQEGTCPDFQHVLEESPRGMPKRASAAADEAASKQSRGEATRIIVSSLSSEGKVAVAKQLLKELASAAIITSDAAVGRRAAPNKRQFPVTEYATPTPQPLLPSPSSSSAQPVSTKTSTAERIFSAR